MSQATLEPTRSTVTTTPPWVIVLHGNDPVSGYAATWHLTPLGADDEDLCRVERVSGDITHPAVWMQATKETSVVSLDDAFALMRTVVAPR